MVKDHQQRMCSLLAQQEQRATAVPGWKAGLSLRRHSQEYFYFMVIVAFCKNLDTV